MLQVYADMLYVGYYVTGVCRHVIMLDVMLQVYADMLYVGYYVAGVCRHVTMLDVMLQVYADMLLCWILCYRCMQTCYYVGCRQ